MCDRPLLGLRVVVSWGVYIGHYEGCACLIRVIWLAMKVQGYVGSMRVRVQRRYEGCRIVGLRVV